MLSKNPTTSRTFAIKLVTNASVAPFVAPPLDSTKPSPSVSQPPSSPDLLLWGAKHVHGCGGVMLPSPSPNPELTLPGAITFLAGGCKNDDVVVVVAPFDRLEGAWLAWWP